MNIEIVRSPNEKETPGTLNVLNSDGATFFKVDSLELPYLDNKNGISCIPPGVYDWEKVSATAHIPYPHISIKNVPNRSGICIHIGNFAAGNKIDIEGCVLVGRSFKDLNGDGILDISESSNAFKALMEALPNLGKLTIK